MLKNIKPIHIILAVSLALNMVFIGAGLHLGSKFRNIGKDANWIESRLDRTEARILRHFEGDDRALARQVFRARRAALTEAFQDVRTARAAFRDAMATETPNADEMTAALNASQDAASRVNEAFHGALRDMAQGLSPEGRRKVARHMKRHRRYNEDAD
jgi:uncharacterized membrane protein